MNTRTHLILLAAAAVLLSACGSNVTMDAPSIPRPLIDKLPVSVGLRMPDDFESFVHEEEVLGREKWSIDLGRSNAALFEQLFEYMFEDLTLLGADDDPGALGIDALIEPEIDDFEFSVPSQSRTDAFAVWIRYRLKVYDRDGDLVSDWPVSAYGKSQTGGGNDALRRAAVLAMRDAAALMIMRLDQQTGIGELAEAPASEPPPTGGTPATDESTPAAAQNSAPASDASSSDESSSDDEPGSDAANDVSPGETPVPTTSESELPESAGDTPSDDVPETGDPVQASAQGESPDAASDGSNDEP